MLYSILRYSFINLVVVVIDCTLDYLVVCVVVCVAFVDFATSIAYALDILQFTLSYHFITCFTFSKIKSIF